MSNQEENMIIVIGSIKGGVGKSTIASNLTVIRSSHNKKVLLVDADEQRSTYDWAEHRDDLGIPTQWTTVQLLGKEIKHQLNRMRSTYEDIIVDVGGRDTDSQRSCMLAADIYLIPFQPRSLDIWTLGKAITLISDVKTCNKKLKCYAVINRADSQGSDNKDAIDIISASDKIHCLPCIIKQRKAFSNAASEGLGVTELKNADKKAAEEMLALYQALFK